MNSLSWLSINWFIGVWFMSFTSLTSSLWYFYFLYWKKNIFKKIRKSAVCLKSKVIIEGCRRVSTLCLKLKLRRHFFPFSHPLMVSHPLSCEYWRITVHALHLILQWYFKQLIYYRKHSDCTLASFRNSSTWDPIYTWSAWLAITLVK